MRERKTRKKRKKKKKRGTRGRPREGGENAFAYEIKWRIYTVRSQYTYVRPTVNYTVNRRVLFDRRGKEDRARCPTRTRDESPAVRGEKGEEAEKNGREDTTTAEFMEREMIYGTIVENKSHGSKDV